MKNYWLAVFFSVVAIGAAFMAFSGNSTCSRDTACSLFYLFGISSVILAGLGSYFRSKAITEPSAVTGIKRWPLTIITAAAFVIGAYLLLVILLSFTGA
jgi:uncharacterized membrane protein YtjA (UPF0391 family)